MSTRDTIIDAIRAVAPELADSELTDDANLQQDLDLDSMDFLDFVTELSERTDVAIPESDYDQLTTIGETTTYLARRTAAA